MPKLSLRSWVEISRSRLVENLRGVRAAAGHGSELLCVVKADAYGHGAVEVSRLLEAEGVRWFGVSHSGEGVALRKAGIRSRILVMADFLPFEREALANYHLTPVIHSLDDLRSLDRVAAERGATLPYHLKIDSGMGRLGTSADAEEILQRTGAARHVKFEGLMTHFASSADYTSGQTEEQLERFDGILSGLRRGGAKPEWVHLSSTNAVAFGRASECGNLVRVGHALYGYISPVRGVAPRKLVEVKPALAWKTSVLAVKDIPKDARVGYGAMFRAPEAMRIGVLAVGYADGYPHRLSNRGKVIAGGQFAQVLGAVSMDLTTIDLSRAPHVRPGDAVTLLGTEGDVSLDAQQLARMAGTISYSLLCGINPRVRRVYID